MPILHKEYVCPAQRSPSGAWLGSLYSKMRGDGRHRNADSLEYRTVGTHISGGRNRDSGSFAGSSGDLGMNLGRRPDNYLRVRKNHPASRETVLFGHRSPPNLNDKKVDWLAAFVGREYNAAHSDRSRHRAFYLSDC
jgi:hypothetical protein